MKLAEMGDGSNVSFESWDDVKSVLGWTETALKRRKRETDIAIFLRHRISDYVEGYLTADAFRETCHMEAETIANGGSYGASFLSAIGPAVRFAGHISHWCYTPSYLFCFSISSLLKLTLS